MHDMGDFVGVNISPEVLISHSNSNHNFFSKISVNKYKSKLNYAYGKFGGFEFPVITNASGDANNYSPTNDPADTVGDGGSLASTNANTRPHDRVGVEFAGEVPQQGFHCVMYQKKFNDWPIAIGLSAFASGN